MLHHTVYRTAPDADWIVLVHGAGVTSSIWEPQIEAYRRTHNLLLPDLRGHGGSAGADAGGGATPYTWEAVSRDVLQVMDHHGVERAHFVAVSMGSIVVRTLAELAPQRVRSMVFAGVIAQLDLRARTLIALAHALKSVVPYMWLYRVNAWIVMPRRSHRESRRLVVREAGQLGQREFLRWLQATHGLPERLQRFEERDTGIPTLYVMGDEDHMFLPGARTVAARHPAASLHVIEHCGHVCSVQRAETFNRVSLDFLARVEERNPAREEHEGA